MNRLLAYWHALDPVLKGALKTALAAASGAAASVVSQQGIPTTRAGWAGLLGAIVAAELALYTHAPQGPAQGIVPGDVKVGAEK